MDMDYSNTFKFFIDSTNGTSRIAGESHNDFKINIPNHVKGGYKDCKVRLRKIYLPANSVEGPTGSTCLFLDVNFLKPNQFRSGFSSMTNQTLSTFSTKQDLVHMNSKANIAGNNVIAVNAFQFLKMNDDGEIVFDDSRNLADQLAFESVPRQIGLIGATINDDWIDCDNPFGKNLSFRILDMDHLSLFSTGNDDTQRTIIELEFHLEE